MVKALVATESSFEEDIESRHKNKALRAYGLMQVLGDTFKILQDEGGEIKDHYINVAAKNYKNPSANLASGIRWLIHKYELHKKNHPRADWIDAISKYKKLPRSNRAMRRLEQFYLALKNQENIKGKGGSR